MTRKDFQLIADIIAKMPSHAPSLRAQKASVTSSFADGLAVTNPAFDKARFIKACQVNDKPRD